MSLKSQFPIRVFVSGRDLTAYVTDGATFSNVDGSGGGISGFEACSLPFPMDLPNVLRGDYIRIDCGLGVAWEGRVKSVQRSLGEKTTVQGEGYSALFADQANSMVFVDRDLTQWQDPSYTRQLAMAVGNEQLGSTQVAADPTSNTPALVQTVTDSWDSPYIPVSEAWYDAGPENVIESIFYWLVTQNEAPDTNWVNTLGVSDDANGSTTQDTGNLGLGPLSGAFTPSDQWRFAFLDQSYPVTPGGVTGATFISAWSRMSVYGNHGLTGRGGVPFGFYPSDIFGWVLSQVPGLQAGITPLTDDTGYIVPHSVYYTPVTLDQIVGDMSTISGWHWGVWESLSPLTGDATPRADFRPRPDPGQWTAFCHRSDCDTLDITEDLSQQYDVCVVTFTDVAGVNGAAIVQEDNPILDAAGIPSRTLVLNGGTMDQASAALFGGEALALTNSQARVSGSADIVSAINGGTTPAWMLRSGIDRLRIGDVPSTDAWGAGSDFPISRVECSLSSSGWTTSVELGTGADLVETLQSRLTAATTLSAQGG